MNTIQSEWEHFRKGTISKDASITQISELRNAFYAGASCAFMLYNDLANPKYSNDVVFAMFENIINEIEDYRKSIEQNKRQPIITITLNKMDDTDKDA